MKRQRPVTHTIPRAAAAHRCPGCGDPLYQILGAGEQKLDIVATVKPTDEKEGYGFVHDCPDAK